jgi:ribosomal protein S27AE
MNIINKIRQEQYGFMSTDDLDVLIEQNRLCPVLVRCGNGRFVAPAQDVKTFIKIIQAEGSTYVRDISLQ